MPDTLRPYQLDIATAVLDSVFYHKGLTFSVEIARQGGKNELSARLERLLLILNMDQPLQLVKCSPTFKPQTVISMMRLKDRLNDAGFGGVWTSEMGYIVRLGDARAVFLSADASSNVVGNTAHLLLEVDESQDVNKDKYTKDFSQWAPLLIAQLSITAPPGTILPFWKKSNRPIWSLRKRTALNVTSAMTGRRSVNITANIFSTWKWNVSALAKIILCFSTQYRLLPIHGGGGFFNSTQKAQLQGTHSRLHHPSELKTHDSKLYIAAIDLAGEAESEPDYFLKSPNPKQDSTVLTIAELSPGILPLHVPSLRGDSASAEPTWQSPAHFPSPLTGEGEGEGVTFSSLFPPHHPRHRALLLEGQEARRPLSPDGGYLEERLAL